jgi:hypothetical protein
MVPRKSKHCAPTAAWRLASVRIRDSGQTIDVNVLCFSGNQFTSVMLLCAALLMRRRAVCGVLPLLEALSSRALQPLERRRLLLPLVDRAASTRARAVLLVRRGAALRTWRIAAHGGRGSTRSASIRRREGRRCCGGGGGGGRWRGGLARSTVASEGWIGHQREERLAVQRAAGVDLEDQADKRE